MLKKLLIALLSLVLFTCTVLLAWYWIAGTLSRQEFDDIAAPVQQARSEPAEDAESGGEPPVLAVYAVLAHQNSDFCGWVSIADTAVDYPVMHTPEEPERYLRKNFEKEYALCGTPFLDGACTPKESVNLVVYGHNMKDGSMFADLAHYRDPDYLQSHPFVQFDTLTRCTTYRVFAVVECELTDASIPEYYDLLGTADAAAFDGYIRRIESRALYETGLTPQYGDRLLTLSTCTNETQNGRILVYAYADADAFL